MPAKELLVASGGLGGPRVAPLEQAYHPTRLRVQVHLPAGGIGGRPEPGIRFISSDQETPKSGGSTSPEGYRENVDGVGVMGQERQRDWYL